jgi:hypothetical protein
MAQPTIHMRNKRSESEEGTEAVSSQRKPVIERYLLQVDRQTKSSFAKKEDAQSAGAAIKKRFPIVHVEIYDTNSSESLLIG